MTISRKVEGDIRRLHFGEHWKVGTIVGELQLHRDVVRRVVGLEKREAKARERAKLIDKYAAFIGETLERHPRLRATRVYDMIRSRGYKGSVRTVREHVKRVRPKRRNEAFLVIETLPGEQSQVDWAHVGTIDVPGGTRPLWVFVLVLSYSRAMWAELVYEQTAESLRRSLVRAAEYFGGVTRQWLFDNPKTITLERYGNEVRFHPLLLDTAGELRVSPRVCTPRSPEQKGKVERTIRYLKERFFAGRTITSIARGNDELLRFLHDIANARPHPRKPNTTVVQAFSEERACLLDLPPRMPQIDLIRPVSVDKTASIRFDTNAYSVPQDYVGRMLTLVADDAQLRLLDGEKEIARHARNWGRAQRIDKREHREAIVKRGADTPRTCNRLRAEVPEIDKLFRRWLAAGHNVGTMASRARSLLDLYGVDVLRSAIDEAIRRDIGDVGALSQLCERARKQGQKPLAMPVQFANHVRDRDVAAHDLGEYDE